MGRLDAKSNPWVLDESDFTERDADDKYLTIKNDKQDQKLAHFADLPEL